MTFDKTVYNNTIIHSHTMAQGVGVHVGCYAWAYIDIL
jgi:hypothetical protein